MPTTVPNWLGYLIIGVSVLGFIYFFSGHPTPSICNQNEVESHGVVLGGGAVVLCTPKSR